MNVVDNVDYGGGITNPPCTNLINLSSIYNSLFQTLPFPRLINPNVTPAANEYPSLSITLSVVGFLPINPKATSEKFLFPLPKNNNPNEHKALVGTLGGNSKSNTDGISDGICTDNDF